MTIAFIGGFIIGALVLWSLFDLCHCFRNEKEWKEAMRREREEP